MDLNFEIVDIKIHSDLRKEDLIALTNKYRLQIATGDTANSLRAKLDLTKKVFKEAKKNLEFKEALQLLIFQDTLSDEISKKFKLLAEFKEILEPIYSEVPDDVYENVESTKSDSSVGRLFKVTTNIVTVDHKTPSPNGSTSLYVNQTPLLSKRKLTFKSESDEEKEQVLSPKASTKNEAKVTTPVIMENIPLIRANTYSGSNQEDANAFIEKYNTASKCNKWQDQTKIELFPTHLSGTAYKWGTVYLKRNPNTTWENLEKAFLETFSNVAQIEDLQTILEQRIQLEFESPLHYLFEIAHLARRIDPDVDDKKIIDHVIQGIKPEYFNELVRMPNTTLTELEKNIKELESWFRQKAKNLQKFSQNAKHTNPQVNASCSKSVHFVNEPQSSTVVDSSLQDQINNIQETLASLKMSQ